MTHAAVSLLATAATLAVLVGILAVASPGRVRPVTDQSGRAIPGSIAQKVCVPINGVEQGMVIRSADPDNPVLLFVHGGPGMPEYFLDAGYPTGLERDFTVVWWDQRGAGLSYAAGAAAPASMTVEQLVDDTIAVTDHLRERFGQPKIYLLGHSWGSYVAIRAAQKAPDRFHAYIGMGQITHQIESESIAYEYALARSKASGDASMLRRLEATRVTPDAPLPKQWLGMRDDVMHRLGVGTTRDMDSVVSGIFVPSWTTPEYTLGEKLALWRGKAASRRTFWDEFLTVDLRTTVPALDVPAYFVHGRYDYTTAYDLALDYHQRLAAPVKGFYTFEDSAHSPAFEEPQRLRRILREDVLNGENALADAE